MFIFFLQIAAIDAICFATDAFAFACRYVLPLILRYADYADYFADVSPPLL